MDRSGIMKEALDGMNHALGALERELRSLRTGRASVGLLEGVRVSYYGTETPLQQVANVSVADAQTLVCQPWDPSQVPEIEKAILKADLGLNPMNDGKVIRIPIPKLTEERRKEIVKRAHTLTEEIRNEVRRYRREANDHLKKLGRDHELSADDEKRAHDEIQKLHDDYMAKVNGLLEAKEKEILTV